MATFARPRFCAKGHSLMSKKRRQVTTSVTTGVKLRRISCDQAPALSAGWWRVARGRSAPRHYTVSGIRVS